MNVEEIEYLINKGRLTDEDKSAINDAADALGITYTIRRNCRKCYDNILLKLYEKRREAARNVSIDGYALRNVSDDFIVRGVRYNNVTIEKLTVDGLNELVKKQLFVYHGVRSEE
ncbi:MAG: hypothetical protein MJZ90_10260 [Bacteroidales bacterium]|nr:hypothetical protein [Bacteroidales bacterium]